MLGRDGYSHDGIRNHCAEGDYRDEERLGANESYECAGDSHEGDLSVQADHSDHGIRFSSNARIDRETSEGRVEKVENIDGDPEPQGPWVEPFDNVHT